MKTFTQYLESGSNTTVEEIKNMLTNTMGKLTDLEREQLTAHPTARLKELTLLWHSLKTALDTVMKMEDSWKVDKSLPPEVVRQNPEDGFSNAERVAYKLRKGKNI